MVGAGAGDWVAGSDGFGQVFAGQPVAAVLRVQRGQHQAGRRELRGYGRGYLRSQIGFVQQEPFLFSTTIRNNITYGTGRESRMGRWRRRRGRRRSTT